jgi:type IV secretory pathway TraG/TraD family ATPase VirD4
MYVLGKTGTGKSTLLETMIRQDMEAGAGIAVLDPHGELVEKVISQIPESRRSDLIYFNVPDPRQPLGFNPLETVSRDKLPLATSGLLEVFKKIWNDSWGPRLEHILRNALLTLFERPDSTLADILRLLDDKSFRKNALFWLRDPQVRDFWLREFENYPARLRAEAIAPIQNKVGAFLANPLLRKILVRPKSSFRLRAIMDEGKIFVVNLAKGKIGEETAALLGALIVSRIGLAGLSRANIPEQDRRDFYVYLDEFQSFTTLSLANMFSELRKYRVNMILANQFLAQLEPHVREAILGNVGTIISFRVGPSDAEILEKEFYPEFTAIDLTRLPNYHVYLKLMVDGDVSVPFSGTTLEP